MKKGNWITLVVIIAMIILSIIIINQSSNEIPQKTAICIGENSKIYVQLGCHACELQEDMFGTNYKYLNVTDCWFEKEKCGEITATPTWIINERKYIGVQSLEKLKELTGCS